MKILLLLLLLASTFYDGLIQEVENIKLSFPAQEQDIFQDYMNENFIQKVTVHSDAIYAEILCTNFMNLNLEFRVIPDEKLLTDIHGEMREVITNLFGRDQSLKTYLMNISYYLRMNIRYLDGSLPQDAESVLLNKKANCIGYSNLVKMFLDSAGIRNRIVRGFYINTNGSDTDEMTPVPHRWVEIELPNKVQFFYDPQYQKFSANYILTLDNTDFKRIKKFKVRLVKKSKKIIN